MFSKLFALAVVATLAMAAPAPNDGGSGSTTGTPQCCQSIWNAPYDPAVSSLVSKLIGVDVSTLNVPIGTGCSGIAVAGGVEWYASSFCPSFISNLTTAQQPEPGHLRHCLLE
jgi:hypothetical protein